MSTLKQMCFTPRLINTGVTAQRAQSFIFSPVSCCSRVHALFFVPPHPPPPPKQRCPDFRPSFAPCGPLCVFFEAAKLLHCRCLLEAIGAEFYSWPRWTLFSCFWSSYNLPRVGPWDLRLIKTAIAISPASLSLYLAMQVSHTSGLCVSVFIVCYPMASLIYQGDYPHRPYMQLPSCNRPCQSFTDYRLILL